MAYTPSSITQAEPPLIREERCHYNPFNSGLTLPLTRLQSLSYDLFMPCCTAANARAEAFHFL